MLCCIGWLQHTNGRQIWFSHQSASGTHGHGHGHGAYTSFEELQRLTENPFENNTNLNLTVPLGDTAFLRCKVRNLGERSVSRKYILALQLNILNLFLELWRSLQRKILDILWSTNEVISCTWHICTFGFYPFWNNYFTRNLCINIFYFNIEIHNLVPYSIVQCQCKSSGSSKIFCFSKWNTVN